MIIRAKLEDGPFVSTEVREIATFVVRYRQGEYPLRINITAKDESKDIYYVFPCEGDLYEHHTEKASHVRITTDDDQSILFEANQEGITGDVL